MVTTLIIILTSLLTAAIAWLLHRSTLSKHLAVLNSQLQLQGISLQQLEKEKNQLEVEKDTLLARAVKSEGQVDFLKEKLETQKQQLEKIGDQFRFEFRNLAQTIFDEKSEKFVQLNEEKMKLILDPLKNELGQFKQKVEETYDKESKERFSLGKEIERLIATTQVVGQEANNLTTALKGSSKRQGDWGEMILESLLENSGLTKNREYFLQEYIRDRAGNIIKDENGKALQPDVTIYYPDHRKVIIDSKVSLIAWDAFVACDNKEDQDKCIRELIKHIRTHIDSLSKKNYPKYAGALDYVLLFIPIEPAFLEAVKTDVQLWKDAYDKRILLVSPTNLFAVLKIISDLWKVEQQNKNAIEIAEKAGAMYDKVVLFVENMETVGKKLDDARECYGTAFKQLSTGRGNILVRVEELKRMGANASKQLPDRVLEELNGVEVIK
jgi:DNA recombination protein RmuC